MNKSQENKLTMLNTVNSYLKSNLPIVTSIDELNNTLIDFQSKYIEIMGKDDEKKNVLKGKTSNKKSAKDAAIRSALAISGSVFAYGKKLKDNSIMEKSRILKSALNVMRDTELTVTLESLRNLANLHIASLQPFGLTQSKLDSFSAKITAYNFAVGEKEDSGVKKTGATKSLKDLFKSADDMLLSMDNIIKGQDEEYPEFVRDYFAARSVKNLGVRHSKDVSVTSPGNEPKVG